MRTVKLSQTVAADPEAAARAFYQDVVQPDMALVVFFCSSQYDLPALAKALKRYFADTPVVGCTTAGELGPSGYQDYGLTGASFADSQFAVTIGRLPHISTATITNIKQSVEAQTREHQNRVASDHQANTFGVLLIDGASQREDAITSVVHSSLPAMPLVGGSAGDDLEFRASWVFQDGQFHKDSALLILLTSTCPMTAVKSQHFMATDQRLVVTQADPLRRRVTEINGLPAAREYARVTGVDVNDLNEMRFATSPVVVLINGREYVRSIQKANSDGSLTFYSAIEEGLVFRVAHGVDMLENLEHALSKATNTVGPPQVTLAFDCVLRKLELIQTDSKPAASALIKAHNVVGFNSYGEQFGGVHVNQTFTGLAIGQSREVL